VALSLLAAAPACEETTLPPPPDKPEQIETLGSYSAGTTGLLNNDVFAILAVSNGELWIGGTGGIARFPNLTSTSRPDSAYVNEINGLPNPNVRVMMEYGGKVYVGTWGGGVGVYDVVADSWSVIQRQTNGLRNNSIADITAVASENRVYFATNDAVSILNLNTMLWASFVPPTLLDRLVSSVEAGNFNGTVLRWYGPRVEDRLTQAQIPFHGITVSRTPSTGPSTSYNYTTANSGISEPNVNDIFYDADRQTYWVAYGSKGLAEVSTSASTWTVNTTVHGLPSNTVYSITRADGTLWAATQGGLAKRVGENRWQGYSRAGGLQADRVRKVYSPDGTGLYLGFIDGGAARVSTQ
jgi:ligand-binding sensor domain-containing protein